MGCERHGTHRPLRGFRFLIEVDRVQQGGFTRVKGLQRETKLEIRPRGRRQRYEHKLVTLTTYPNLVLERGLADPYLWIWHELVVQGQVKRRTLLTMTLRDESRKDVGAGSS